MNTSNYDQLVKKLDGFIRKYYKNRLIRGGLYSVSLVVGFFLAVVLLEYFARFDTAVRTGLFFSFIAATGYVLVRYISIPLLKLYRLGEVISHNEAARIIGRHFPDVEDKLINTLQLRQQAEASPGQADLLLASIDQRTELLTPLPFNSAIDLRQNRRYLKFALPPTLLMLMIVFAAPSIITDSTERLVNFDRHYAEEAPFEFLIENDKLEAVQQEDFELNVRLTGDEVPASVFIEIEGNRFKLQAADRHEFKYTFKNLQRSTEFRLSADEFYSDDFELTALPNPILLNFDIELDFPAYLGKKSQTVNNTGDLLIPAGTKVNWRFATLNTERMRLSFADTAIALTANAEDEYRYGQHFLKSTSYAVTTHNQLVSGRDSVLYAIDVIPDRYPEIEAEERKDSTDTRRLYFRGKIEDDYGFKRLAFTYQKLDEQGEKTGPPVTEITEIKIDPSQAQQQFFHLWDFSNLTIEAGDRIEYYFEVWDNDGVNGSKSTRSQKRVFKAPTREELSKQTEENNQEIKDDIEESLDDVQQLQKDIEDINRKLSEKKQLGWQEKKKIQEVVEKQKELEKKIEKIKNENQQNNKQQQEFNQMDERLLEKQKRLEELFEQVMTDEMKELFNQLEELMEELNKEDLQEMLDEMELNNEDIEKELDRSLEIFKQLEFEQKLEETIEKLDELQQEQEELSEESQEKDADSEDLKEKQEELNEKFDDLKEELEELEKKNDELESPNEMADTEQQEEDIDQEMENSSEQLDQNKKKKASESQKNAAEKMDEMKKNLQQMQEGMEMQSQTEDLGKMRELLENLVQLSFDQEQLMLDFKQVAPNDPKYTRLTQEQKKLKDDAQMIEDSLFALSKRVIQIEPIVNREISAINANMDKSLNLLTDQPPNRAKEYTRRATTRQQYVMTSINNLALLLDEVVQQMQQQMSQQKFGNSSCNKPGSSSQSKQQSMMNMRKMQEQLNQQIEKLRQKMGKNPGGQKGKKPGQQLGMPGGGHSKELAKMAAQQEAIRNELRKLANELEGEGEDGGKGRLNELTRMMEETETDLVNRQITLETLKRQQEIMTRLLESEKAERERDLDEKRESREADEQKYQSPAELFDDNTVNDREIEMLKTVPPALRPFYKRKVNEYFNGLEQ